MYPCRMFTHFERNNYERAHASQLTVFHAPYFEINRLILKVHVMQRIENQNKISFLVQFSLMLADAWLNFGYFDEVKVIRIEFQNIWIDSIFFTLLEWCEYFNFECFAAWIGSNSKVFVFGLPSTRMSCRCRYCSDPALVNFQFEFWLVRSLHVLLTGALLSLADCVYSLLHSR